MSCRCRRRRPAGAMFVLGLPFLALLVASVDSHPGLLGPKNVSQKDAEFERTYVDEVNSELVNIYTFNHTVTRNRVRAGAGLGLGNERADRAVLSVPHGRTAPLGTFRFPEPCWTFLTNPPPFATIVSPKLPMARL